jgi:hypothetical protein
VKKLAVLAIALFGLVIPGRITHAQTSVITAGEIATSCSSARNIKLPNGGINAKKTADLLKVGQCVGFLKGWIEGADGTTYQESNGAYVRITMKRAQIKDVSFIAESLVSYLTKNPNSRDKAADDVLRKVLHERGLLSLAMVTIPPQQ